VFGEVQELRLPLSEAVRQQVGGIELVAAPRWHLPCHAGRRLAQGLMQVMALFV
jgi:hypothetical protein